MKRDQMVTMGNIFWAGLGILSLYCAFTSDPSIVDCGSTIMSPGQQCTTTTIQWGNVSSSTRNYEDMIQGKRREGPFFAVLGTILLLAGVGPAVARAIRNSDKNSGPDRSHDRAGATSNNYRSPERSANYWHHLEIEFLEAAYGVKKRVLCPEGGMVEVTVPAGIENGQALRLAGKGKPGKDGGKAGDALIGIVVKPHPSFTRNGLDICVDVPVSEHDMTSGALIEVPTLKGPAKIRIPEGAVSGQILRVPGRGITCARSGSVGHLLVKILARQDTAQRGRADPAKNDRTEEEFRTVFFSRAKADRERIIAHWMTTKSVGRTEAMRLAIEDWRKDNRRYG